MTALHHWYHIYADGAWQWPVGEHFNALTRYGLLPRLTSLHIGFVGSSENIAEAHAALDPHYEYETVAESPVGWEQETLNPMYDFVQDHDGLVSYAHTKGASRSDPVDLQWRRSMEFYNFVEWHCPVESLESGYSIAGCHWQSGGPSSIPGYGTGGMFGGNYWWTRCELLRQNVRPGRYSRFEAEHWLGQLSEVTPITPETICDMNPGPIGLDSPAW